MPVLRRGGAIKTLSSGPLAGPGRRTGSSGATRPGDGQLWVAYAFARREGPGRGRRARDDVHRKEVTLAPGDDPRGLAIGGLAPPG
eukprot:1024987-Alexandrium_andersonii.AAC.1